MFLKHKNIIFKIRRSKVTGYAALNLSQSVVSRPLKNIERVAVLENGNGLH